ncbi:MAG TPA: universal stress protein [Candidatus Limnocylindrales bacterium]|nr:universal stress protein [Candidatus Limnocylindrales bacterium]
MKVLLAIDGSDASMSAVAAAAALPIPSGSTVEIVSVIPHSFAPEGAVWPNVVRIDPPNDKDRIYDDVSRRLLEIADRIRGDDRSVEVRVLDGRPATEIVAEAERFEADLVVMGARGLSSVRRLLLGSVSSEVVDHAPCPVLIARHAKVDRVLLATDGSPSANEATTFVAASGLFGASQIRIISIGNPGLPWWVGVTPADGMTSIDIYTDEAEASERHARHVTEEAAERLGELHVTGSSAVRDGDVVSAILHDAKGWGADLIVLGARNMGTMHRWLVGSVSRSVLHMADASVLIVRPGVAPVGERTEEWAVPA